jgi:hypothetical protein
MDAIAVKLERLKRAKRGASGSAQAPAVTARHAIDRDRWRGLAGAGGRALKVALIIALPFAVLVVARCSSISTPRPGLARHAVAAFLPPASLPRTPFGSLEGHPQGGRGGRALVSRRPKWVATPLVLFYCSYSLLYIASVNAKSEPVRAYYRSVHPLLRLSLSTLILIDRDMLITDAGRQPEDYTRMGLRTNSRTRHYRQADGWIHAVALRTTGRGAIKNRGVQLYFWLMGFETLRHVGTADHLHVELN